jgi:hypothetical protein
MVADLAAPDESVATGGHHVIRVSGNAAILPVAFSMRADAADRRARAARRESCG